MSCGRQFVGGYRLNSNEIWELYTKGKQTYSQLSKHFDCSIKTIQRYIDKYSVVSKKPTIGAVNLLVDTTYFGRTFGVMVFKDAITGNVLKKAYVKNETNALYQEGIESLKQEGFSVKSIVCDGRKGLMSLFPYIPVQMCQFHQIAIVTRYLTRKPKTQAGKALRELSLMLTYTDKESFVGGLEQWYQSYSAFVNERTVHPISKRSHYTHKRLRSAYNSLRRNLPWLFTWYDNIELGIPNTTNALDGSFSDLKNKLRCHNGLSITRKKKFIDEYFKV